MKTDIEYLSKLKDLILNGPRNFTSNIRYTDEELYQWVIDKTSFLPITNKYTVGTRIYYVVHDIHELPKCCNPSCNKIIEKAYFTPYQDKDEFYKKHCCNRCIQFDPQIKKQIESTSIARYGCRRGRHDEDVFEKRRQTCLSKFGVDSPLKAESVKLKIKNTLIERYGSETTFGSDIIKQRVKDTLLSKYGVKSNLERKDVQDKCKETLQRKYGISSPFQCEKFKEKAIETFRSKYGSDWYLGSSDCIEKTKKFFLDKYGVDHQMKVKEILERVKKTNRERYGKDYVYLYDSDEFKELMVSKYGVEYPSQNSEVRKKYQKRYTYNNISFDSKPEIAYYIWLSDNNIVFEYQPDTVFEYSFKDKTHYYMPDFKVNDDFIEIKGDYFFDSNGCMINPFRDKNWSDEEYAESCMMYEEKHQCMIRNNVRIIRDNEFIVYLKYVNEKYGKNYLNSFKNKGC